MAGRAHPRDAAGAQLASARPKVPVADTAALGAPSLEAARRLLATVEDARAALLEVAAANLPPAHARRFREVAARPYDVTPVLVRVRRMRDAAREAEREAEDAARASERVRPVQTRPSADVGAAPTASEPLDTGPVASPTVADVETARLAAVRAEIARVEAEAAVLLGAPTPETSATTAPDPVALAALAVQLLEQGVPRELVLRIVGFGDAPSRPAPTASPAPTKGPAAAMVGTSAAVAHTEPVVIAHTEPVVVVHAAPVVVVHAAPVVVAHTEPVVVAHAEPVVVAHAEPVVVAHAEPVVVAHAEPVEAPDIDVAVSDSAALTPAAAAAEVGLEASTEPLALAPPSEGEPAAEPAAPSLETGAGHAVVEAPAPDASDAAASTGTSDSGTLAAWGLTASEPPLRAPPTLEAGTPSTSAAEPPPAGSRRRARLVPIGGASVPSEPVRPTTPAPEVRFQGTGPGAHEEPQGLRGLVPAVRFPGPDVPRQTARAEHGPGFVAGVRWGDLAEARPETTTTAAPDFEDVTETAVRVPDAPVLPPTGVAPVKPEYTLPERADTVTLRPVEIVRLKGVEAIVLPPVNDAAPAPTPAAPSRPDVDDIELDPWFDEGQAIPARLPEAEAVPVQEATLQVRLTAPTTVAAPARRATVAEAQALAAQGRLDAAAEVWDTVVAQAPDDVDARVARGLLHLERSDFEAASADLQRAQVLAPDRIAPLYGLGDLAFARKAYAEAIEHYDAGLARVTSRTANDAMALCRRGLAHHYLRDWTRAVEDLEAARAADPDIPHVSTFANMARARARGRG